MSSLLSQADAKLPKSPSTLAAAHSDVQPARRTYRDKERELRQRELAHLGYERDLREALEASRQLSESRAASTVPSREPSSTKSSVTSREVGSCVSQET